MTVVKGHYTCIEAVNCIQDERTTIRVAQVPEVCDAELGLGNLDTINQNGTFQKYDMIKVVEKNSLKLNTYLRLLISQLHHPGRQLSQ